MYLYLLLKYDINYIAKQIYTEYVLKYLIAKAKKSSGYYFNFFQFMLLNLCHNPINLITLNGSPTDNSNQNIYMYIQ